MDLQSDVEVSTSDQNMIRLVLESWATTTRRGQLDQILANHDKDALIYDVLPPMKYEGAEAYQLSWKDWHPETSGEAQFELQDLAITAGEDLAFAHGFIQCGGTAPGGKVFSDTVRATFCLRKQNNQWKIVHQHISKPYRLN